LAASLPEVSALNGTAEDIPLESESVDGCVVAQAFHWFDGPEALAEIARVLRAERRLVLAWNVRDERVDWQRDITELIRPYEGEGKARVPRHRERRWRPALEATDLFEPVEEREFEHAQEMDEQGLVDRVASMSMIAVLPEDERAQVLERARSLARTHPALAGRQTFEFPHITEVYLYTRR
jgi:SAM-dependent methyltransferase